ncbi:MAG: oligosaccharide flippase family protein [Nibricoccus sp.]
MKLPFAKVRDRLLPITLGQAVGFVCGVLGVKVSTRLVTPSDYGAYGVFLSFAPLGMWVVHAGLIKFVGRHWAAAPDRGALLREVLRAGGRKLPWLVLGTLAASFAMTGVNGWAVWPALTFAASSMSVALLTQTALQAERSHWADLGIVFVASTSRSFLPPLLYAFAGGSLFALQAGYCLHTSLYAAAVVYLLLKYKPGLGTAPTITAVYEGPLFITLALAGWVMQGANRWIVASFFGATEAGYFTLASNITIIVTSMLGMILVQYFQPGFFAAASEEPLTRRQLATRVDRVAFAYTVLALAGVATLRLIAPHLIGPLIDEKYRAALPMIVAAGCFGAAVVSAQFFHTLLLAGHREKACGPVDIGTAAVLVSASAVSAVFGEKALLTCLAFAPVVPWLLTRTLARHYYFKPAACGVPEPAP